MWRAARDTDVTRLWPAVRTLNFIASVDELVAFHRDAPWRVRVSDPGDAMILAPWRAHLSALAIRGAWAAPHRVDALVRETGRVARAQGFTSVVSHLMPVSSAVDYLAAGMTELESLVALQGDCRVEADSTPDGITLRRATQGDIATLQHVDAECFDEFWRYGKPELAAALRRERVVLAFDSSGIIGYATASVHGATCTLGRLAVRPAARRAGVARALVADVSGWARGDGAGLLTLCTQSENAASRALYRSLGLVEVEEPYMLASLAVG